jgi:hypothetical protein
MKSKRLIELWDLPGYFQVSSGEVMSLWLLARERRKLSMK